MPSLPISTRFPSTDPVCLGIDRTQCNANKFSNSGDLASSHCSQWDSCPGEVQSFHLETKHFLSPHQGFFFLLFFEQKKASKPGRMPYQFMLQNIS